ncbi:Hpt domain-containing protein [Desulfococcaceae bacterium HSG9]|nr:Hpt domain-containing protein [Desulfococcaceae bacterium HSG9]
MKNESQAPIRELKTDHHDISQEMTQSVSADDILPEDLPGIDIKSALQRMGDNKVLYKKLLIRFYEQYGNSAQQIRNYLELSEFELARQLSHTVKGIAGNLAINKVYHSAMALETKLRNGDVEEAESLADKFETALEPVTEGLLNLYRKAQADDQLDKTGECEENVSCEIVFSKIKPLFDKLGVLLKENNLEAEQCLEALRKELQGTEAASIIRELKNQIDLFDFDEARKTYKKLKKILEKA